MLAAVTYAAAQVAQLSPSTARDEVRAAAARILQRGAQAPTFTGATPAGPVGADYYRVSFAETWAPSWQTFTESPSEQVERMGRAAARHPWAPVAVVKVSDTTWTDTRAVAVVRPVGPTSQQLTGAELAAVLEGFGTGGGTPFGLRVVSVARMTSSELQAGALDELLDLAQREEEQRAPGVLQTAADVAGVAGDKVLGVVWPFLAIAGLALLAFILWQLR